MDVDEDNAYVEGWSDPFMLPCSVIVIVRVNNTIVKRFNVSFSVGSSIMHTRVETRRVI